MWNVSLRATVSKSSKKLKISTRFISFYADPPDMVTFELHVSVFFCLPHPGHSWSSLWLSSSRWWSLLHLFAGQVAVSFGLFRFFGRNILGFGRFVGCRHVDCWRISRGNVYGTLRIYWICWEYLTGWERWGNKYVIVFRDSNIVLLFENESYDMTQFTWLIWNAGVIAIYSRPTVAHRSLSKSWARENGGRNENASS